jgi:hypothetical protein
VSDPIFVFDSREQWWPVGVEESLEASKALVPPSFPARRLVDLRPGNRPQDRLDFPADMRQPDLPPVVYRRQLKGGPLTWRQYWLWYLYNPKRYAGFGEHEGDWELVQVGYCRAGEPILVTCSQHKTGSKREYWTVELRDGRPVIYVALDSHANYFVPGQILEDSCDGQGRVLKDYELRPFGAWASWGGRWGNSGNSPQSPGCQGSRWSEPHRYHSQAR